jgi:hypothetical protein
MIMRTKLNGAALAAILFVVAAVSLGAQPLPAFQLGTRDGGTMGSDVLPATGQWLLVYVVPGSAPSDRLVQSLGESWNADKAARVIIVVGADARKAQAYLVDKGGDALAAGTWYVDPDHSAWAALGFQGTLGVAGMAGSVVDWKVDGVIQDPSVVAPVVRAWLDRGAKP